MMCASCLRLVQDGWTYCPYCGAQERAIGPAHEPRALQKYILGASHKKQTAMIRPFDETGVTGDWREFNAGIVYLADDVDAAWSAPPPPAEYIIELTPAEIRSNYNRVQWADGLIRQLPETHEGRNSWLLNYGTHPLPCNCAGIAPTMQTYRTEHLPTCPCSRPTKGGE